MIRGCGILLPIESEAERGIEDGAGIEGKDRAIQSDILDALAGAIRADVVTRGTASRAASRQAWICEQAFPDRDFQRGRRRRIGNRRNGFFGGRAGHVQRP